MTAPITGATIFNTYTLAWETLTPSNNSGVAYNHTSSGNFGTELRLMKLLVGAYGSGQRLVKYALGGTGLDSGATLNSSENWNPTNGTLYSGSNNNYTTATNAISYTAVPHAYVWMQGEADASANSTIANNYQANLIAFIAAKRSFYHAPNMPFIIVQLSNGQDAGTYPYLPTIQAAQAYAASHIANCYLLSTNDLTTTDGSHYNAAGYDIIANRVFSVISSIINTIKIARRIKVQ